MLQSFVLVAVLVFLSLGQRVHGMIQDLQWSYQVKLAGNSPLSETQRNIFGGKYDQGAPALFLYGRRALHAFTAPFD